MKPTTVSVPPVKRSRVPSVTTQIFTGLVVGIVVGYVWPAFGVSIKPLADTFLRMIKMIIAPLLFSTLVVGIAGTGDLKAMGGIGLKAIIYFEISTTIALFLGLFIVNFFQPGAWCHRAADGDRVAQGDPEHPGPSRLGSAGDAVPDVGR